MQVCKYNSTQTHKELIYTQKITKYLSENIVFEKKQRVIVLGQSIPEKHSPNDQA